MVEEGLLLYCISNSYDPSFNDLLGLDASSSLTYIKYKDLYGIVSPISLLDYNEETINKKSEDVDWITEQATKYMEIIQSINNKSVVIPMKFLTLFKSSDRIKEVIKNHYDVYTNTLSNLLDASEFSLKIYCNKDLFKDSSMDEEISVFEESIQNKPKGAAFFLRKKFEQNLYNQIDDKLDSILDSIHNKLKLHCKDYRSNKLLAKEITGVTDSMISNTAFLIYNQDIKQFADEIETLSSVYKNNGITFAFSGPWPPYNFCT